MKRELDLVVLSDLHLGTIGSHATELIQYLDSIDPHTIVLNGDIIDMWNFKKHYWPEHHMLVLKKLIDMMSSGTQIHYLTGNHDEVLRKISPMQLGPLSIKDKLVMNVNGDQCWFFHGDIFDITMKHSKWIAKMGAVGYDLLILLNQGINKLSEAMGRGRISLSRRIKNSVKRAVKFIDDFEKTAMDMALDYDYRYVVCGHIHQPKIRDYFRDGKQVTYMNSGDWIEHMTALEFDGHEWNLYYHDPDAFPIPEEQLDGSTYQELEEIIFSQTI
jgi:UDP-2,3-diacylglucosamine pyrophosphatase LpxH